MSKPINRQVVVVQAAGLPVAARQPALRSRIALVPVVLALIVAAHATDTSAVFLGAKSCASSSCHGGGGANQNQYLTWSLKDFHSQRPVATLSTARAKQIADALGIKDATADERCTSCHAPLNNVPPKLRGEDFKVTEGVTCESCHGPAENWLRAHTRKDYTRADRTAAGMRDLENLYIRANTCVACHQVVTPPLLKAGHPELIFELDGQSVSEPRHWRSEKNGDGAQAWFVGQAVALREMSSELSRDPSPPESEVYRWRALLWLMSRARIADLPAAPASDLTPTPANFEQVQKWSDALAQSAAKLTWSDQMTQGLLPMLTEPLLDFSPSNPQALNARRAERLVLALDRLFKGKAAPEVDAELSHLFSLTQSLPDFDSKAFAEALEKFSRHFGKKS